MKKLKLITIFLFIFFQSGRIYSQQLGYIPPSPQSFSFVRSTDVVSENEHVGAANVNIPLFTFSSGKLATNVNLNYSGTGVKVDDLPNDTGMTWILDTGGVITRTVNGLRDEFATLRMNKSEIQIMQTTSSDCDADEEVRTACYSPQQIDTERDIFEFRVAEISGSFYLDENFIPIFLKNDSNVKIKNINLNNSTNNRQFEGFEITDVNGIKYVFGGSLEFQEKTASKAMPDHPAGEYATSSYFIKEVEHPNGEKISFTYNDTSLETKRMFEIHQRYLFDQVNVFIGPDGFTPNMDQDLKISTQTLFTKNKKRIQTISSNRNAEVVNFIYSNTINSEYTTFLSAIEYKTNNDVFKKITFDYLFEPAISQNSLSERFYLTGINFYNKTIFEKKYQFAYNDPLALPKRLSYGQDMFGYFNGKSSNFSLIAGFYGNTDSISPIYEQTNILSTFGDRTPDFTYASKGVLTEIIYPTGGKTKLTYECPKKKGLIYSSISLPDLDLGSTYVIENLPQNLSIQFKLGMHGNINHHMEEVLFKIKDLDTNANLYTGGSVLNYAYHEDIYNFAFQQGKRYLVDFEKRPYSFLTFDYPHEEVMDGFGIRLQSIEDSDSGQIKSYRRLYYSPVNSYTDTNTNLASLKTEPTIQYVTFFQNYNDGFQSSVATVSYALHSSSNSNDLYNSKLQERYSVVSCSMGGDNFENGGYEKEFRKDLNDPLHKIRPYAGNGPGTGTPSSGQVDYLNAEMNQNYYIYMLNTTYFPAKGNRLSYSGTLNNVKYLIKKNGQILKNKQIDYTRNYNILGYNTNLFISHVVSDPRLAECGSTYVPRISPFFISTYKNYIVDTKLKKQTTTDFIDPIPVYQYNMPNYQALDSIANANARKLITTITYDYENPSHNQLTKKTISFSDNLITRTTYAYAHEKNNQLMISKNMIGIPLEESTVEKQSINDPGKTVSRTETLYPTSLPTSQSGNLVLPLSSISYNVLNNTSSTEVTYDKYDDKGNLLQYTGKDGIPVAIIWGYNKTQPIAKVEGIAYDQLTAAVSIAGIVTASDNDAADPTKEGLLLDALKTFRKEPALSGKLISTYTYDPLIGVTSITPPSGVRQVYTYDAANRLKEGKVRGKNSSGNYTDKKVSENNYNYKP
ncbi:hypothetical protein [uncultured Chryseobacterium sp.]|uniref:hypothetical protein n=1 Tax=uncultured Chryseobacterium sp. TaxID=259322 RepID=UPI0025CED350|nr:hypothetical protein [uncultured Chryseobacterium sp.]